MTLSLIRFFSLVIVANLIFFNAHAGPLKKTHETDNLNAIISNDHVEVVYFFSYHCQGCFAIKDYIGLWSETSGVSIKRVPVFSDEQWHEGARIYTMMLSLSTKEQRTPHNVAEFDKFGFSEIALNKDHWKNKDFAFNRLQSTFFPSAKLIELQEAWEFSNKSMESIGDILTELNTTKLVITPSFRVSSNKGVTWVSLNEKSENPGLELVKTLNSTLIEHKR